MSLSIVGFSGQDELKKYVRATRSTEPLVVHDEQEDLHQVKHTMIQR